MRTLYRVEFAGLEKRPWSSRALRVDHPMTARIIDGKARALRLTEEIRTQVAARVAAGKPTPGLAVVLVGDNPASQVYVRNKRGTTESGRHAVLRARPSGGHVAGRAPRSHRPAERRSGGERDSRAAAAAEAHRRGARDRAHRSRQGRRRLPSLQHRAAGAEAAHAAALHAVRVHDAAEGHRRGSRRQARGRDRPVEHRRPADGARAPDGAVHGDDLPFEDARPAGARPAGRHRRGRRRQGQLRPGRLGEARAPS